MSIFEGDIAIMVIRDVEFPLDSHMCMCQSLAKVAANFKFLSQAQLVITCHEDPSCSFIKCAVAEAPDSSINFSFYPCKEAVYLDGLSGGNIDEDIFDRNESRPFSADGLDFVVDVVLINRNFSMDFQVHV